MRIQNNIPAMNTHRVMGINNTNMAKSLEKLSSGYRVNRAGDDAAGLAISEKMRAQIRGLTMASKNSSDAISLVQTAEGALQSTHDILQRMRELAVQSASDTNEQVIDRGALDQEFQALKKEINDIASKTVFNDQKLIDGTFSEKKFLSGAATNLLGPGMTFAIGDVAPGVYNFKVGVETITAAATAAAGNGYVVFDSIENTAVLSVPTATFALDANAKGAMYNGNYTLSVTDIKEPTAVEFTLTGDNGLTFTYKLDMTAAGLSTNTDSLVLDFAGFGKFTVGINSNIANAATSAPSQSQLDALIAKDGTKGLFDDIKISITGGKDAVEATFGVFASITGGEKVQLEVGDNSISFTNGITVNFNTLTASDLDTKNAAGTAGAGTNYQIAFGSNALTSGSTIDIIARANKSLIIQTGANQGDELAINIERMNTDFLGVTGSKISSQKSASAAITQVNDALNKVSTQRAALGALQNRLEFKISNLDTSAENLQAAESRIRDVDMALEMTKFTKSNILSQAATAMLAQANSLPQNVLQLLR